METFNNDITHYSLKSNTIIAFLNEMLLLVKIRASLLDRFETENENFSVMKLSLNYI